MPGGALEVDRHGPGRGAWLCRGSVSCLADAVRRHGFERAFAAPLGEGEAERLRAQLVRAWEPEAPDVRG